MSVSSRVKTVDVVHGTELAVPFSPKIILPVGNELLIAGACEATRLSPPFFQESWRCSFIPKNLPAASLGANEQLLIASDSAGTLYRLSKDSPNPTPMDLISLSGIPLKIAVADTRCALLYSLDHGFRIDTYSDPSGAFNKSHSLYFNDQTVIHSIRLSRNGDILLIASDSGLYSVHLQQESPPELTTVYKGNSNATLSFPSRWPKECFGLAETRTNHPTLQIYLLGEHAPGSPVCTLHLGEKPTALAKHPLSDKRFFVGYASGVIADVFVRSTEKAEVVRHFAGPHGLCTLCLVDNGRTLIAGSPHVSRLTRFSVSEIK